MLLLFRKVHFVYRRLTKCQQTILTPTTTASNVHLNHSDDIVIDDTATVLCKD